MKPALVTEDAPPSRKDLFEEVADRFNADKSFAYQWITSNCEHPDQRTVADLEERGWEVIKDYGVSVEVMGMTLMRKSADALAASRAEDQAKADKQMQDALDRMAAQGITVETKWGPV